jgi:hypothetical protein
MENHLSSIFENLSRCEVTIRTSNPDHYQALFDHEDPFEVEFNGFWSLNLYREWLHESYLKMLSYVKEKLKQEEVNYFKAIEEFHNYILEIRAFRRHFFHVKNMDLVLSRVICRFEAIEKTIVDKDALKRRTVQFIKIQTAFLKNLEELFKKTIANLQAKVQMLFQQEPPKVKVPIAKSTDSGVKLQWAGTKTEFFELCNALHKTNYIKNQDGTPLKQKDMFNAVSQVFNVSAGNYSTLLNAASNRKLEKSVLFTTLSEAVRHR